MTASQEERVLGSREPLNGNGNITPDSDGSNGNITPDSDGSYAIIDSHFNGNSINGAHYPATPDTHTGSTASEATFPPIAICGMACRLPGGISSPSQLWDFLLNKQDARSRVPSSRYNVDAFYSATEKPGTVKTQHGYFLDEDLAAFDGSMFSMSPMELARCDPQQRLMLEVARECVEEAGETDLRGKEVGVYIGNFGEDWHDMLEKDSQQYGVYRLVGAGDFALANRVSYEMDLRGPR
jgi:acyl transferase domain-containing protein